VIFSKNNVLLSGQPNMIKTVNNWCNIIQYSLLPPNCIFCGRKGEGQKDLCGHCLQSFAQLPEHCSCCARAIPKNALCGHCQKQPPYFNKVYAPYPHQGEIRYLINQLKFENVFYYSKILGELLADFLQTKADYPDTILPVPLHPNRYKQRNYNQSLEIAKVVSKKLNIPIDYKSCIRIKDTAHQINLDPKQRKKNIQNCFKIKTPFQSKHIAILDDVITTGATANELAKILKAAGAERVDIWVCSRA